MISDGDGGRMEILREVKTRETIVRKNTLDR